jgi:hypothetical protein
MNGFFEQGNIEMRFKTIGTLCLVSFVVSTGSPALAAAVARHDAYGSSREQQADVRYHPRFTACTSASELCAPRCNAPIAPRDDWPAEMILG